MDVISPGFCSARPLIGRRILISAITASTLQDFQDSFHRPAAKAANALNPACFLHPGYPKMFFIHPALQYGTAGREYFPPNPEDGYLTVRLRLVYFTVDLILNNPEIRSSFLSLTGAGSS